MKKLLLGLTALFTLSFMGLNAEVITKADTVFMFANKRGAVKTPKDIPGRGYCNSVEVSASVLPKSTYNVSAAMVFGYRFNKYIFLGGGLGLSYLHETYNYSYNDSKIHHYVGIPVFVRAKFNFTKKRVSPFFGIDLGGAMFWDPQNDGDYYDAEPMGYFLFRPHIGIDINVSDNIKPYIMVGGSTFGGALFFGAGCKF
ncbi:MAG: hypothetical protein K2I87_02470 [Bacteroidales bacterium]|nr:hypothetical protein [Bacteroidales bacterium]